MLERYPRTVILKGVQAVLRPLKQTDEERLLSFFRRIPVEDRALLKDNVSDPTVIKSWCASIDYSRVFPLLALVGDRVIADATLHFDRSGWMRHVARVRVVVDPEFRGMGVASTLVCELIEVAPGFKVEFLDAEFLSAQTAAIRLFERLGFRRVATLPDHVRDQIGNRHHLIILSREVSLREYEESGSGD